MTTNDPASICRRVESLAQSGRPEAVGELLPFLRSRSEMVQDCVRDALNGMDAAPAILRGWRSPDPDERATALGYAVALEHPGLMAIYREAAGDTAPRVRERAAIGLKRQKPTGEVYDLFTRLAADPDRGVRWWAIDSLRAVGSSEARPILESRHAKESDPDLRSFIERALSADGD